MRPGSTAGTVAFQNVEVGATDRCGVDPYDRIACMENLWVRCVCPGLLARPASMISDVIRKAHAAGIKIGICGQGPNDHPDFAAFLVREGIDSLSLNPNSFLAHHKDRTKGMRGAGAAH
jgi:hypothetical protein